MLRYRPNVCIAIKKPGTDVFLLCHRKGFPPEEGWQFPQGGLRGKSDLISEMRRELLEEIGTDSVKVIKVSPRTYSYEFPRAQGILIRGMEGRFSSGCSLNSAEMSFDFIFPFACRI